MGKFLARLDEKVNLFEILRKFSKFSERFLKKIAKMHDFSVFFKRFKELWGNFSPLEENANSGKIFKNLSKKLLMKIAKNALF